MRYRQRVAKIRKALQEALYVFPVAVDTACLHTFTELGQFSGAIVGK